MTNQPNRYREIKAAGRPREMGRQIGEAAREEIRGYAEIALERVNKTMRVSRERAIEIATRCIDYAGQYSPDMLDEIAGMSDSSGVSVDDLMLLQVRNQLTPDADAGCTSLSISRNAAATGCAVVGQNWDNDPELDKYTVVLTRRPDGKPALMNVTQAGLIAYIGFNDAGIGACLNTLPAPSRDVGVPHYFTLRGIYESQSLDEAVDAVARAHRAIPANIMLTTPQGPADLEITVENVHVLRPDDGDRLTHTNHCLHNDLLTTNDDFPELIESHPRLNRINELIADSQSPLEVEQLKDALRDHSGYPKSICRHPNDHPNTGFWTTVFSVIIEPEAGLMHVSRGTPCDRPYESYRLT